MPRSRSSPPSVPRRGRRDRSAPGRGLRHTTAFRYAAGSVIATVCSEVVFLALYGPAHAGTTVASVVGWLAGAVPNYWLNRSWAWRRSGRPSLHGELLPYVVIVLVTLLLATVSTGLADRLLQGAAVSESLRWALVGGTFLAVYGVLFVVRFLLLDRLFRRDPHPAQEGMSDG